MKNVLFFILLALFLTSCTKGVEKPAVTIGQFSKQSVQMNEVANKLMNETDIPIMNKMADGVEATRAITCDAVGEECNAYYEFLNKVVDLTKDGELSNPEREALIKMQQRMQIELEKSEKMLQSQWKAYINSDKRQ